MADTPIRFWQGMQKAGAVQLLDKILLGRNIDGSTRYADINQIANLISAAVGSGIEPTVEPNTVLPAPAQSGKIMIMKGGSYTQPGSGGGTLVAPANSFNVGYWDGNQWQIDISIETEADLSDYVEKPQLPIEVESTILENSSTIGVHSKNMINESAISIGFVGGTGTINNSNTDYRKVRINGLRGGAPYTFSAAAGYHPSLNKNIVFFSASGEFLQRIYGDSNNKTFIAPAGTSYAYMTVAYVGDGDSMSQVGNFELMWNRGTTAEPYEPYAPPPFLTDIFGMQFGSSSPKISYSDLKQAIAAGTLTPGISLVVEGAPGGLSLVVNTYSSNQINEDVTVLGLDYDFYKLDLDNDIIRAYDNIACICRNSGGTWAFINDSDHTPKGVVGISAPTSTQMRIDYGKNYTKIHSLVYAPDETYAQLGVVMGASVGLSFSLFQFSTPSGVFGQISGSSSTLVVDDSGWKSGVKTATFNNTNGDITVTHSSVPSSPVLITDMVVGYRGILISKTDTSCVIRMTDADGNIVLSPSTAFKFQISRPGVRILNNTDMAISGSNIWVQGLMMTEII